jgi:hypothetical protein
MTSYWISRTASLVFLVMTSCFVTTGVIVLNGIFLRARPYWGGRWGRWVCLSVSALYAVSILFVADDGWPLGWLMLPPDDAEKLLLIGFIGGVVLGIIAVAETDG